MQEEDIKRLIKEEVDRLTSFTVRKLTDTPTDDLMVVNRKYVNLNGTSANRPNSSVATTGQKYFDTTVNIPIAWDGSNWRNGVGSVV